MSSKINEPSKKGYLPPHLKAKLPPKTLSSEDIKDEKLFPILNQSHIGNKSQSMDFSQFLKDEPILPLTLPKERVPIASHPLVGIVVYDMTDEDICKAKDDPSFISPIESVPVKKKPNFFSLVEEYLLDKEHISYDEIVPEED